MADSYFTTETFSFLQDLEKNNNREWFKASQGRFEEHVREPALEFIEDFQGPLENLSRHFVAIPKKVGGSLFRIHRDTRFGKDKTPYKLNTGVHFRHKMARDAYAPGYYIHIEPENCFMGVGLWHPDTKLAYEIRAHIHENQDQWVKATQNKNFSSSWTLEGDSLKRTPKGYEPDHPLLVDLKRKDFIAVAQLDEKQICSSSFADYFAKECSLASPFMALICEAVGVQF